MTHGAREARVRFRSTRASLAVLSLLCVSGVCQAQQVQGTGVGPNNLDACLAAVADARHKLVAAVVSLDGVLADEVTPTTIFANNARWTAQGSQYRCSLWMHGGKVQAPEEKQGFSTAFMTDPILAGDPLSACWLAWQEGEKHARSGYAVDRRYILGFDRDRVSVKFHGCLCQTGVARCAANLSYEYAPRGTTPNEWLVMAVARAPGKSSNEARDVAADGLLTAVKDKADGAMRWLGPRAKYEEPTNQVGHSSKGVVENDPVYCDRGPKGVQTGCIVRRSLRIANY